MCEAFVDDAREFGRLFKNEILRNFLSTRKYDGLCLCVHYLAFVVLVTPSL